MRQVMLLLTLLGVMAFSIPMAQAVGFDMADAPMYNAADTPIVDVSDNVDDKIPVPPQIDDPGKVLLACYIWDCLGDNKYRYVLDDSATVLSSLPGRWQHQVIVF